MTGKIIEKVFYLAPSWQKTSTLTKDKGGIRHTLQGRIQGGHTQRMPPPKIGKNMIFFA